MAKDNFVLSYSTFSSKTPPWLNTEGAVNEVKLAYSLVVNQKTDQIYQ